MSLTCNIVNNLSELNGSLVQFSYEELADVVRDEIERHSSVSHRHMVVFRDADEGQKGDYVADVEIYDERRDTPYPAVPLMLFVEDHLKGFTTRKAVEQILRHEADEFGDDLVDTHYEEAIRVWKWDYLTNEVKKSVTARAGQPDEAQFEVEYFLQNGDAL